MIDVTKFLTADRIILDLSADTKEDAIRQLVKKISSGRAASGLPLNEEDTFRAVMERENQQTTGIGNGLAVPHARIEGWRELSLVFGLSRKGIDFDSLDGQPVNFIVLLISSHEEPYIILQVMSVLIRVLVEEGYGKRIFDRQLSVKEVLDIFRRTAVRESEQILASDLARPVIDAVHIDASVEDATRKMHLEHFDVLPVVDGEGKYRGEISCLNVFEYGMPDFFKNLNTISFVRHIDPFEKYFRIKGDLKVRDVYVKGSPTLSKDATLLEVIFEMTVKNRSKLFVVEEDGTLIGVIDRFCVIDKILFF